jgi:hypothetical protein
VGVAAAAAADEEEVEEEVLGHSAPASETEVCVLLLETRRR